MFLLLKSTEIVAFSARRGQGHFGRGAEGRPAAMLMTMLGYGRVLCYGKARQGYIYVDGEVRKNNDVDGELCRSYVDGDV